MENSTFVNCDHHTYLVTFLHTSTNKKFICSNPHAVMEVIKKYGSRGIENIKEFDFVKNRFSTISKNTFLARADYYTEARGYFKTHYYFKK